MIKVYGSSDDLVEIEGDITEEFSHADPLFLCFSEGTAIRIQYTEGIWEIRVLAQGQGNSRVISNNGYESDDYSDVFTLEVDPPVLWVMAGDRMVRHA